MFKYDIMRTLSKVVNLEKWTCFVHQVWMVKCCGVGLVLKNEVGERLEIEVETVAKSAILQEFCIV